MRVLFCGTRQNIPNIKPKIIEILNGLNHDDIIIHGGCSGVDSMVDTLANELNFKIEKYCADWSLGRRAGPLRNQTMLDSGIDICYAFPLSVDRKLSKGTWNMIDKVKKNNIPCIICYP